MKRLFQVLVLLVLLYAAKPLWEGPVSNYVDLSFLEPIDRKVETVLDGETIQTAVTNTKQTVDKAVAFLNNKTSELTDAATEQVEMPTLSQPATGELSIHNIEIGTPEHEVTKQLGQPKRTTTNEYGTQWLTFHQNYQNFVMLSYDAKRQVNAIYTNDRLISSSKQIEYGSAKADVRKAFGRPIKEIRKGTNIYMLQDDEGLDIFHSNGIYTYVFYDLHKGSTVTAVMLISDRLERQKPALYAHANEAMRQGFELQLFDLTNAARVRHGRSILAWDGAVAGTARKHSADMAMNDYFAHENLNGESPFDRMKKDGIHFIRAGENLAYGQSSSIFAHEGLMNSKGHRENILIKDYSHLGIGVDFNQKEQPFYTEKFLLK